MSHIALQRIIVRMLYDPTFADAVYRDASEALSGVELSESDVTMLLEADRRAWRLDPMRRTRALQALLEEYPVACALVAHTTDQGAQLDLFFSSSHFHRAIQERGSLALAFGSYLAVLAGRLDRRDVEAFAHLEEAIARSRRPRPHSQGEVPVGTVRLADGIKLVRVPRGVIRRFGEIRERMTRAGLNGGQLVLSTEVRLEAMPVESQEEIALVEPCEMGEGPTLTILEDALAAALIQADPGTSKEALFERLRSHGAESGEEEEILEALIEDGLLMNS